MSEYVTTSFGDLVAFERRGQGPAIVFVAGAGPWRSVDPVTTETAVLLANRGFTTVVYDRVGRGESWVEGSIDIQREMAALSALIGEIGASAVLCGHSSGCSLALFAAANAVPVAGLALWEAPLDPVGTGAIKLADELRALLQDGDLEGALDLYMHDMPPEILEQVKAIPAMIDQARSLQPDADSLAWAQSGPLIELFAGIHVPVIVMVGNSSYDEIMVPAAESIAAAIPGATWTRMPGAHHQWEPQAMATGLAEFLESCRS